MWGKQIAVGLTVVGLALTGCSDDKSVFDEPLAGLTTQEMCGLVAQQSIDDATGTDGISAEPGQTPPASKGRPPGIIHCRYELEGGKKTPAVLRTSVYPAYSGRDDIEELNESFKDIDDKLHKFQRVEGLGRVAGYGADPLGAEVLPSDALAVVFKAGPRRFKCTVAGQPGASLEQLKPLAAELVRNLEKQLG